MADLSLIDMLTVADTKKDRWKEKQPHEMLAKIMEEMLELVLALSGHHEGPPRLELIQIASTALNMLRQMDERNLWRLFPNGTQTNTSAEDTEVRTEGPGD